MQLVSRWLLIWFVLLSAAKAWSAPSPAEQRALAAAEQSFQLGLWERAEKQFAAFVEKHPKADDRAQAVLRQAQAQIKQGKLTNAVELLSARPRDTGRLADEYQFWLGEAHFQATNYAAAAEAYLKVTKDYTNSPRQLEASYDVALARSKLGDWARVSDLLSQFDGPFQLASLHDPTNDFVIRGKLLLGEAQLALNDLRAAEETLNSLEGVEGVTLVPELDWRRHYLRCRVQLAGDRAAEALQTTSNLLALAALSGRKDLAAETAMLRGGILEQLKMYNEAVAAYESNLAEDLSTERRRQAVLKIVELQLARNKVAAAAQRLEGFIGEYSKDIAVDVALLTVGELHLKEYLASPVTNQIDLPVTNGSKAFPAYTNHLRQAYAQFDWIINNFPRSPSVGKAMLDRAWCLWLAGQVSESRAGFRQAAEKLPFSLDQALARYKWADCQMFMGDYAGALTNYNAVLTNYPGLPSVKAELAEPALYQVVRVSLEQNDLAGATNALGSILVSYPDSFYCDRGMLLTGEKLSRAGNPAQAREIFNIALKRPGVLPLAAEIELAVARTYEQERNWGGAVAEYDGWLSNFVDSPARSQTEYARAWALWRNGQAAEALNAFSGFIASYPTNELAPLAQNWIADYHLQQADFKEAEAGYQLTFQKWPAAPVAYSARLMAGRAALAQGNNDEAIAYFTQLINDKACPPEFVAQAFFDYGDATTTKVSAESEETESKFAEAIVIFSRIPQLYPTNDLVPLAWGRIANCYLQLGTTDANQFTNAFNAYLKVLDAPRAGISARSQAEVGIGDVLEKQTALKPADEQPPLLKQALDRYLNVALATNLRGQELPDAFWVKRAGLDAARVAETLGEWQQAVNLYQRLEELLPPLKEMLDKKISRAREKIDTARNGG